MEKPEKLTDEQHENVLYFLKFVRGAINERQLEDESGYIIKVLFELEMLRFITVGDVLAYKCELEALCDERRRQIAEQVNRQAWSAYDKSISKSAGGEDK